MHRLLLTLIIITLTALGCAGRQAEAQLATSMALAAETAKTQLLAAYDAEGKAAIPAPDRATSDKQVETVKAKWAPVWMAFGVFAVVHGAWADAIEQGAAFDLMEILAAFCDLRRIIQPFYELPSITGIVCPNPPDKVLP